MPMFSKLFSFIKKKETKTPDERTADNYVLATDALESGLAQPNVKSRICVASEEWLSHPTQQALNITLVQGASDSKPAKPSVKQYEYPKQTSSIHRHVNITPKRNESVQYLHPAPSCAATSSTVQSSVRLYPDLKSISTQGNSSRAKKQSHVSDKNIHDVSEEIRFQIQPKILYGITQDKALDRLKNDAKIIMLELKSILRNSLNLEYTFNKEIDVSQNYSHVKAYEKMHTFDDVKSRHQKVNQPIILDISNDTKAVPIFLSYRQKLRCYKGRKNDIIDCE